MNVHRALASSSSQAVAEKGNPKSRQVYRDCLLAEVQARADLDRRSGAANWSHPRAGLITTRRCSTVSTPLLRRRLRSRRHWSHRRTRRIPAQRPRLRHHRHQVKLSIRGSAEWFVEFILYHEMLHIKHPARLIKGRRFYHTKAFRAEEERFPYFQQAQDWLDSIARQRRTLQRARAA